MVFQSALKLLIVEFARIFYIQIFMQNYPTAQNWDIHHSDNARESTRLKRDADNQFTWYWTSHASTRTRYLDIVKVCWLLNLIAGPLKKFKVHIILASDILRCSSE